MANSIPDNLTNVWQKLNVLNLKLDSVDKLLKPIGTTLDKSNKALETGFGIVKMVMQIASLVSTILTALGQGQLDEKPDIYAKIMGKIATIIDAMIQAIDIFSVHYINLFEIQEHYIVDDNQFQTYTWNKFWDETKWQTLNDEADPDRPLFESTAQIHGLLFIAHDQAFFRFSKLYDSFVSFFSKEYVTSLNIDNIKNVVDKFPYYIGMNGMKFLNPKPRDGNDIFDIYLIQEVQETYSKTIINSSGQSETERGEITYQYKTSRINFPENIYNKNPINSYDINSTNFLWDVDAGEFTIPMVKEIASGETTFEWNISSGETIPPEWKVELISDYSEEIINGNLVVKIFDWPKHRERLKKIILYFIVSVDNGGDNFRQIKLLVEKRQYPIKNKYKLLKIPENTFLEISLSKFEEDTETIEKINVKLPALSQSEPIYMFVDKNGNVYYDDLFLIPIEVHTEAQIIEPNSNSIPPDYNCLSLKHMFPFLAAFENILYSVKDSLFQIPISLSNNINDSIASLDNEMNTLKGMATEINNLINQVLGLKEIFKQQGIYVIYASGIGVQGFLEAIDTAKNRPQFKEGYFGGLMMIGQRGLCKIDLFANMLGILGDTNDWTQDILTPETQAIIDSLDADFTELEAEQVAEEQEMQSIIEDINEISNLIVDLGLISGLESGWLYPPVSGFESGFISGFESGIPIPIESGIESGIPIPIESGVESGIVNDDIPGIEEDL